MSISDIQKQLRDAVELACSELQWHGQRDGGEEVALSHLKALASSCGCEAKTAGEMAKAIANHIDWLAGQCKDTRVEPAECDCCDVEPETVEVRIAAGKECVRYSDAVVKRRIDELVNRVSILEERLRGSST